MDTLNILVLHRLGDPEQAPLFLRRHVFKLKTYCPKHNYIYHDVTLPLPDFIRSTKFDAIILDVTLLCLRWADLATYQKMRQDLAFIADSNAFKIAYPQDDYDCHKVLDDWMCDWNVDIIFSVISSHWDILYPRFHSKGEIRLGFTGYIDDALVDFPRLPFHKRNIDIGYRARKLLPYFGGIGETKWQIGLRVAERARSAGLQTDIIIGDSGTLLGLQWLNFINNSKFTLGSNSGSGLLDPYGEIQRAVRKYLRQHPQANFQEVESQCFVGLDGRYTMTAISPRVFEAGLLESCQILVEGKYSGVLQPWQHYIPIKSDATDFDQVFLAMQDPTLVDRLIRDCRSALLDCNALRASHNSNLTIEMIGEIKTRKSVVSYCDKVAESSRRYNEIIVPKYRKVWYRSRVKRSLYSLLSKFPPLLHMAQSLRSLLKKLG